MGGEAGRLSVQLITNFLSLSKFHFFAAGIILVNWFGLGMVFGYNG